MRAWGADEKSILSALRHSYGILAAFPFPPGEFWGKLGLILTGNGVVYTPEKSMGESELFLEHGDFINSPF